MNPLQVEVNVHEVREKLYNKLKSSGWGDKLRMFIMSDEFENILNSLVVRAKEGKRFTPVLKQVFRAFEECPYQDLKVVIIGQDPYIYPNVADGLAFSCSNTSTIQPSLKYIYQAVEETVYPGQDYFRDPDLKKWANQGVLLLNSALTTTINKVGDHYTIWKPFMEYLFDVIGYHNSGLVYVFMGRKAEEWAESIPDSHYKIFVSHPASAAHNKQERWDCKDMFNQVSKLVKQNYGVDIVW